jgi:antirestriction protein ArdC
MSSAATTERLAELQEQLTAGVERLVSGEEWKRMLQMAALMPTYSLNNLCLILIQKPDATRVAGYRTWQKLDRHVRKGEKAIWVLAPMRRKIEVEDEKTGETTTVPAIRGFKPVGVFDLSQTEGLELPSLTRDVEGDAPDELWDSLTTLLEGEGYTVSRETPHTPGADGETDPTAHIVRIDPAKPPLHQLGTLIHEGAHIRLRHVEDVEEYRRHRGIKEIEAESVAYIVAGAWGLDSSASSFGYIGGWARGDVKKVRETAARVVESAHEMLADMGFGQEASVEMSLV